MCEKRRWRASYGAQVADILLWWTGGVGTYSVPYCPLSRQGVRVLDDATSDALTDLLTRIIARVGNIDKYFEPHLIAMRLKVFYNAYGILRTVRLMFKKKNPQLPTNIVLGLATPDFKTMRTTSSSINFSILSVHHPFYLITAINTWVIP